MSDAPKAMTMRVDLGGLLSNAADYLKVAAPHYEFSLREAAGHIKQVQDGEATLAEFCELYCLPAPAAADAEPAERIAELEAALERDRTSAADILNGIQRAMQPYAWLKDGRGSYEWDDDRWKDEFGRCFEAIEQALRPLAVLAADHTDCPTSQAAVRSARGERKDA